MCILILNLALRSPFSLAKKSLLLLAEEQSGVEAGFALQKLCVRAGFCSCGSLIHIPNALGYFVISPKVQRKAQALQLLVIAGVLRREKADLVTLYANRLWLTPTELPDVPAVLVATGLFDDEAQCLATACPGNTCKDELDELLGPLRLQTKTLFRTPVDRSQVSKLKAAFSVEDITVRNEEFLFGRLRLPLVSQQNQEHSSLSVEVIPGHACFEDFSPEVVGALFEENWDYCSLGEFCAATSTTEELSLKLEYRRPHYYCSQHRTKKDEEAVNGEEAIGGKGKITERKTEPEITLPSLCLGLPEPSVSSPILELPLAQPSAPVTITNCFFIPNFVVPLKMSLRQLHVPSRTQELPPIPPLFEALRQIDVTAKNIGASLPLVHPAPDPWSAAQELPVAAREKTGSDETQSSNCDQGSDDSWGEEQSAENDFD